MAERILIEARNRTLAVEDGTITEAEGAFDLVLRFPDGEVRPGLINAHDHLHRNHYGRLGTPPYADAYAWGRDIQRRHRREIAEGRALPRREALLAGAWKNLLAGVTTVVHHDLWELLREGVDVLLGSDSLLSGAGDLLDELRIARGTGLVSDERLEGAVGAIAARRLGLPPPSLTM